MLPEPEGGGGFPYKRVGVHVKKFSQEPLMGTKSLFCGRGFKFVSPQRVVSPKIGQEITHGTVLEFVPLKVTKKRPTLDLSRLNTLRGFKTAFLSPFKPPDTASPFFFMPPPLGLEGPPPRP